MDRFGKIRQSSDQEFMGYGELLEEAVPDIRWLIAEVERLRKIEEAAREWKQDVFRFGEANAKLDKLSAVLGGNPRPTSDG